MKKVIESKNFFEVMCLILMIIFFSMLVIGINKIQRDHCESNGGKFVLGYGDRNRCIYDK